MVTEAIVTVYASKKGKYPHTPISVKHARLLGIENGDKLKEWINPDGILCYQKIPDLSVPVQIYVEPESQKSSKKPSLTDSSKSKLFQKHRVF